MTKICQISGFQSDIDNLNSNHNINGITPTRERKSYMEVPQQPINFSQGATPKYMNSWFNLFPPLVRVEPCVVGCNRHRHSWEELKYALHRHLYPVYLVCFPGNERAQIASN